MYKDDIELGKTYYFNNREVVVLRLESDTMAFCIAKCDITHDVTGSSFCTPCMVGGTSTHTCEGYDEAIDYVMEEISDEQVLWIPIVYLKENLAEFTPNKKILSEIEENNKILKSSKQHYELVKENINQAKDYANEVEDRINSLEAKESVLSSKITELSERKAKRELELNSIVKINGSSIEITAKELLSLYKDRIVLQSLEANGVDNWSGYEFTISDEDASEEALNMLVK